MNNERLCDHTVFMRSILVINWCSLPQGSLQKYNLVKARNSTLNQQPSLDLNPKHKFQYLGANLHIDQFRVRANQQSWTFWDPIKVIAGWKKATKSNATTDGVWLETGTGIIEPTSVNHHASVEFWHMLLCVAGGFHGEIGIHVTMSNQSTPKCGVWPTAREKRTTTCECMLRQRNYPVQVRDQCRCQILSVRTWYRTVLVLRVWELLSGLDKDQYKREIFRRDSRNHRCDPQGEWLKLIHSWRICCTNLNQTRTWCSTFGKWQGEKRHPKQMDRLTNVQVDTDK